MTVTIEIEQSDVEQALATGLISMDASRRVGWAKAFEALRRVDSLEEETRQLVDERKHLRRAYSRLIGLVQHLPVEKSPVLNRELKAHFAAERSFRHQDAYDKGVSAAMEHQAHIKCWTVEDVEARREKRRQHTAIYRKLFDDASNSGHFIKRRAVTADLEAFMCSCGEALVGSKQEVSERRMDHATTVVHGVDHAEFKRLGKLDAEAEAPE